MDLRGAIGIVAGAALFAAAAAYYVLSGSSDASASLDVDLGQTRLLIPAAYIRNPEYRRSGEYSEIEIAVDVRDFRPAPANTKLRPGMEDASAGIIFMNLRAQERTLDPAERPARLYVRFLEQDQWTHPGGLVMRRFEAGSPYASEDLYMAPPEGRMFAARCMRPRAVPDGLPDTCISEMRFSGVDVRLRFSPVLLADWERIVAGVRGLVQSMARRG